MASYRDLGVAVENAYQESVAFERRSYKYFGKIIDGLNKHCQVPQRLITFYRWNGEGKYDSSEPEIQHLLPDTLDFDSSDNSWHLGTKIIVATPGQNLSGTITFALSIIEANGLVKVRIGTDDKLHKVNFADEDEVHAFCDTLIERMIKAFAEPNDGLSRTIGFAI